jgi:hypothetical protein
MGPFDHRLPASGAPVMVAPIRGQLTIVRREYLVISGSRRIPPPIVGAAAARLRRSPFQPFAGSGLPARPGYSKNIENQRVEMP